MVTAKKWAVKDSLINYIWLAFWALHVVYMLQVEMPTELMVVGLIAMVAFVLAFHFSIRVRDQALIACIAGEILVFLFLTFYLRISFIGLSLYPAVALGRMNTTKQILTGIAAVVVAITISMATLLGGISHILTDLGSQAFSILSWYLAVCFTPFLFRVVMYWRDTNRQLQAANEQIAVFTRMAERERIARDLHDTLGHTFSMIALKSELAEKLAPLDPARSQVEMRQVQAVARQALTEMRQLVAGLHHVTVQEELQNAQLLLQAAGIQAQVERNDLANAPEPSEELEDVLGNCLRELVTNVVKHSGAEHCSLSITEQREVWELVVQDDGSGVARQALAGHGLDNLRQRLAQINGTLQVASRPHKGTKITVRVALGGDVG